jgi:polar amino acid transport system substrate-binding protein
VLSRGELRVADCLSFAPFGFKDDAGKPAGYDVDLAKEAADRLGVKLEVVDTTSDNRIPNLTTNKVDVVFCNFTENTQRAQQIAFTDPYVVAGETLLVKQDSGIKTVADLSGKTVATVKGSTNSTAVKELNPQAEVQEYDTSSAAVLAVKQGQAAAMVEDSNFQAYQAKIDPTLTVEHDSLVPLEYNGFGVRQGDQDWLNWLNLFLREINTDGTNLELYRKWFGTDPAFKLQPSY